MPLNHLRLSSALTVAGMLVLPPAVFAQAWVPAKGDGSVSLAVQDLFVKNHLATTTPVDAGHINTAVLLSDMTYGLTDKLAVDLAVPFVSSRYDGLRPHPGTDIDNGTYHSTFTDFRMAVRYNITKKGSVITPFVGSVVPSHDYAFYGHSASGERLNELQVGTYVAKLFTSGIPGMFLSGRAAYGFVEKVQDISHNRTVADLEGGYFISPSFRAFGTLSAQNTHGGIDFPLGGLPAVPAEYKLTHDIIQRVNFLNLGAGAAYSISDSFDIFGSFSHQVAGRNGHMLDRGITIGASWGFSLRSKKGEVVAPGAGAPAGEYAKAMGKREGTLGRCICQKSS